jgi:teichuronic acid exporter
VTTDTHTQRTIRGANWNMMRVIVQTVVSLGVTIVVARILPPEDFGLLATAMIFIGLAEIISAMGMGSAVVQRKNLDEIAIRTANTLSVLIGLALVLLILLISEPVAIFFGDERVGPVVRALAISLFVSALSTVSRGLIMRRMDFRRLFFIDSIGHVVGYAGVVITLAVMGYGVWSLVMGTIATTVLGSVLSFVYEPFRMTFKPESSRLKELLSFGGGVSISSVVGYFARNVDFFVIGKFLDQMMLGLYSRAYHLVNLPLAKIAGTLTNVMFSSYSEVQDDKERLKQVYFRVISVTALMAFPVFVGMLVSGKYIITGMYGPNWMGAVPAFQVLCLMGLIRLVLILTGPVIQAMGHVHAEMRRQIIFFVLLTGACVVAVPEGIAAVGLAVVAATLWLYISMAQLAIKLLDTTWGAFLKVQIPGFLLAAVVGLADAAALYALDGVIASAELMLVILMMTSGLAYAVGFFLLPTSLMGGVPGWVMGKYGRLIPGPMRGWAMRRVCADTN